jgi:hypothetical protein
VVRQQRAAGLQPLLDGHGDGVRQDVEAGAAGELIGHGRPARSPDKRGDNVRTRASHYESFTMSGTGYNLMRPRFSAVLLATSRKSTTLLKSVGTESLCLYHLYAFSAWQNAVSSSHVLAAPAPLLPASAQRFVSFLAHVRACFVGCCHSATKF